mmetsp:Transcript_1662/g.2941  ORF Transcript_1662/g.2941 Transcript_1662/m.2941 type:complete len:307 (-) Transcript_1662:183-1103(-)
MITARMNRIIMASRVVTDNFRNRRLVVRCYHATRLHLKKTALVVGSSGCLGSTVAKYLSREEHMNVIGADVVSPDADDSTLHDFVLLSPNSTLTELTENLAEGVEEGLSGESLSAIVVASGAWQMDPTPPTHVGSSQEPAQIYGDAMETMMKINFNPVAAAGYIAHAYMGPQGLFVVMGATAALQPTPGMIGYGVSKAAAHFYVQTLGATTGLAQTSKTLRQEARKARKPYPSLDSLSVIGILPTMLDTPSNRLAIPDGNFEEWTKPMDIAKEIGTWISSQPLRPHSGSLVKVFTNTEGTHFQLVR